MKKALLLILAVLLAGTSACGYTFRGKQNNLPPDVRTIAIPVFANRTGETRIEAIFTDAVLFQFTRSQMLRVVDEGSADAVLRGVIKRVDIEDVAYTTSETSRQRRVTVTVDARLTRTRDGKVLWENPDLVQRATYNVAGGPQATEVNKRAAITQLADTMAQTLHDGVFENF